VETLKKYGIRVFFYFAVFKRKIGFHGEKTWMEPFNQFLVNFFEFAGVELPYGDPRVTFGYVFQI